MKPRSGNRTARRYTGGRPKKPVLSFEITRARDGALKALEIIASPRDSGTPSRKLERSDAQQLAHDLLAVLKLLEESA